MPTYEYECSHCKNTFEMFQNMTDKPLQKCPTCKHKVRRLIGSGAGIIFKGSGFYATDYRKKSAAEPSSGKDASSSACPKAKEGCNGCQQKPA